MKYQDSLKKFTEESIPNAWENVLKVEKTTELLVYSILHKCMETFTDVSVSVSADDPINGVLRSWVRDENTGFGSNAIYINEQEDGSIVLGCLYDISKLREDLEMLATDLFGTIDPTIYNEAKFEKNIEVDDLGFVGGIQRKRIPLNKREVK